jgi:hypothetical protein
VFWLEFGSPKKLTVGVVFSFSVDAQGEEISAFYYRQGSFPGAGEGTLSLQVFIFLLAVRHLCRPISDRFDMVRSVFHVC